MMATTLKRAVSKYKVWLFCLLACIIVPIFNSNFYSAQNVESVVRQMIPYGTVALGLTLGYIAGVINLTIGAMLALAAGIFVRLTPVIGLWPAMLAALMAGALVGLVAAFLVCYVGLHGWLVVISMMIGLNGVAVVVCDYTTVPLDNATFEMIANAKLGPVPTLFLLYLALIFAAEWFLRRTRFGREMYACGGNAEIAKSCGVNVLRTRTITFVLSSTLAALGGVLLMTRLFSANGTLGANTIMEVLPMSIIGGASFAGGKGSAIGTLSGTLCMVLISTVLNLFNVDTNYQSIIQGLILIVIIASDKYFVNKEKKV